MKSINPFLTHLCLGISILSNLSIISYSSELNASPRNLSETVRSDLNSIAIQEEENLDFEHDLEILLKHDIQMHIQSIEPSVFLSNYSHFVSTNHQEILEAHSSTSKVIIYKLSALISDTTPQKFSAHLLSSLEFLKHVYPDAEHEITDPTNFIYNQVFNFKAFEMNLNHTCSSYNFIRQEGHKMDEEQAYKYLDFFRFGSSKPEVITVTEGEAITIEPYPTRGTRAINAYYRHGNDTLLISYTVVTIKKPFPMMPWTAITFTFRELVKEKAVLGIQGLRQFMRQHSISHKLQ